MFIQQIRELKKEEERKEESEKWRKPFTLCVHTDRDSERNKENEIAFFYIEEGSCYLGRKFNILLVHSRQRKSHSCIKILYTPALPLKNGQSFVFLLWDFFYLVFSAHVLSQGINSNGSNKGNDGIVVHLVTNFLSSKKDHFPIKGW